MKFRRQRREQPELNVIPLIDILMVLLIFLMVTTSFSRQTQLHLQLPSASAQAGEAPRGAELEIDSSGRYKLDGRDVVGGVASLAAALRARAGEAERPPLLIVADRKTLHQFVVEALDAAGQAGYSKISFAADEEPSAGQ